jgi:tetratricopeptide (TPR) repeat protein
MGETAAKTPGRPEDQALHRRRMRLLVGTIAGLALAAVGIGVFFYQASAPERAAKEYQAGTALMTPGHYQEAVARFNRALDISPELTDVYLERGIAHQNLGETDAALADFERALDVNPRQASVYTMRATIYRDRKDFEHALDDLSKALAIQKTAETYYERAQTYESMGEHQKAIADFEVVMQGLGDAPHLLRARALAKKNMGDEAGSKADMEAAQASERRAREGFRK